MPLSTFSPATTDNDQKQLCVLLALIISGSSHGYENSVQQLTKRLYSHIKNGYSFSQAEVAKYTKQLESKDLIWKLPYGPNFRISVSAVAYVAINAIKHQPVLLHAFLTEATKSYYYHDQAVHFLHLLFNDLDRAKSGKKPLPSDLSLELDSAFVNLLAQSPYSEQLWQCLPEQWQQLCLDNFIRGQFFNLTSERAWPTLIAKALPTTELRKRIYLNENLAILLQEDNFAELLDDKRDRVLATFYEANTNAIKGEFIDIALIQYKSALTAFRKNFGKGIYPTEITGLLYTVCLFISATAADIKQLNTCRKWYQKNLGELSHPSQAIDYLLEEDLANYQNHRLSNSLSHLLGNPNALAPLFCLLLAIIKNATDEQVNHLRGDTELLEQLNSAISAHQHWLAEQCQHLVNWLSDDTPLPNTGLLQHFTRVPQWQRWLNDISQIDTPTAQQRIVWQLDLTHLDLPLIQAKVQQLNAKGEWTKGRKVNAQELAYNQYQDALTSADHNLVQVLNNHAGFGYHEIHATAAVLQALIGFKGLEDHNGQPLTLIKGEFVIEIAQDSNDCYRLVMQPSISDPDCDFLLIHSHANCYQVFAIDDKQLKLLQLFEQQPNNLTEEKLPQLNAALQVLANEHHISSQRTEFAHINNVRQGLCEFAAVIALTQLGININFYAMPNGVDGPWVEPGIGALTLAHTDDDQTDSIVIKRDLKAEQKAFRNLLKNMAGLFADRQSPQHNQIQQQFYLPEDISQAIELLEAAQKAQSLVLSWDETSQGMRVAKSQHLSLNLNDDNDWLSVSGKISLPSGQIYELQTLLKAPRRGSILEFSEGNSLLLDQRLTNLLNRLEGMQNIDKHNPSDELRIANARALPLHQSIADLGDVTFGDSWKTRLAKFEQTIDPTLPAHLVHILRDYQVVGVKWLMQLANWGLNACLADDMGLGKTLQTLTVLQMRSSLGASVVVAPKSVCHNWQVETERFAPALHVKIIENATACADILATAGKHDLVIVSYGLLPLIGEQLAQFSFANIVFDEAQAIKNPLSLRAKAAFALNGQFKIALSGTPIENHLGELWSLFNFLMPGFLHTLPVFKKRFGNADKNQQQADTLKTLIAPFILRRTKQTVLTELPEKTEINLTFALSEKEQALYEATRLNALEQANQEDSQYITILASLTKLRRACIAPQLLLENSKLPSSKLDTAEAIIEELLENNHQALIFSQFVDVLKLVEKRLQKRGIDYCYLDGSMSTNKRKQQVDKFQAGHAPLFLISLKAGGTGLNLTAADYVLHLDPWWNPAVEQQASDRAHRLGQTRPVTVYRLIAQNTIEEKILQLHEHKQALADKVLAGSGDAGQMSKDQLLALLSNSEM
ncbi:DEAD/DEAH box helicase [Pseudoalteromonas sp. SR44-5]|uniref:DEAD/DEAH box helicase n=1 Tax=Pseudoalteromonas TaxID=53246 RepID=UPI001602CA64|nr:DEAD/DEAH box helicase [Pseudoalteromonas sp. SR44-5]MBB1366795.1 DEAD/DEAH box helicase [Pseudoalteromonas sp. SR44-5]